MTQLMRTSANSTQIARNVMWNLIGMASPMVVAVVAMPILIESLGEARFGILTMVWLVVGYFGLFDMGLNRALTVMIAARIGGEDDDEIVAIMWTVGSFVLVLGLVGAGTIFVASDWLAVSLLKIPADLQGEARAAFRILSLSMPFVIGTAGLQGFLEARQRFDLINRVRLPMGIFTYVAPLAVLPISTSLVGVVGILVSGRIVFWAVYLAICLRVAPGLRRPIAGSTTILRRLLAYGGWMTVSNVVGPLMVYLDRFLVGALVSVTAVAYYATPLEVVLRLRVVPTAVMNVLFPTFAASAVTSPERILRLYRQAVGMLLFVLFPPLLLLLVLAGAILNMWLGDAFAVQSTMIMQILVIGVLCNSLAQVPFSLLQSVRMPHVTGRLHLIELPMFIACVWWMVSHYGIIGAALAWTARVALDAMALFVLAERFVPGTLPALRALVLPTVTTFLSLAIGLAIRGTGWQSAYAITALICVWYMMWKTVLGSSERQLLLGALRGRRIDGIN